MKQKTTFIQFGKSRMMPIPFWLYVIIMRSQFLYSKVRLWFLRKIGKVYDPK